ncbi:MAG: glycosyltransferase [Spirochaetales bacterium]|nr:glycosyltransferase [Leptospiraceae bacterium]MCP5481834.1 glycosyltransferase [Spirochaetales bacterium]
MSEPDRETALPYIATGHRPHLFEIAFEVCRQVGGIYTVIKTKIPHMRERYEDDYTLIGPYHAETAALEFETGAIDLPFLKNIEARVPGLRFGRWLVPGKPRVILVNLEAYRPRIADFRYLLWKDHGIDTADYPESDLDDVILFGFAVSEFFEALYAGKTRPASMIAQFHEWQAGVPILRSQFRDLPLPTVFTTHATILGRYLAGDQANFHESLETVDAKAAATRYHILPRYLIERAAAQGATVFTAVSDVTGQEARALLGIAPARVLPNGIQLTRFQALHEFQNLHVKFKERIHEFVMGHFFPSYTFDLDRTLYFFISGRYEYRNKGFDLFLEAIHLLNRRLKKEQDPPTIVCFVITRAETKSVNVTALENQARFDDIHSICEELEKQMGHVLLEAAAHGRIPELEELLPEDAEVRLRRTIHAFRSKLLPRIVTHDPVHDADDAILSHIRYRQLFNAPEDPVKIVFHPDFLTANSPMLKLDYDQFVRGCHLGVFPGYYEPWGYTPLECIASGIPAVTSDLAGFGSYVLKHISDSRGRGLMVLPRKDRTFEESLALLADYLEEFTRLNRRDRIELRNRTERLGESFDWSHLIKHYFEAHELALTEADRPGPA